MDNVLFICVVPDYYYMKPAYYCHSFLCRGDLNYNFIFDQLGISVRNIAFNLLSCIICEIILCREKKTFPPYV